MSKTDKIGAALQLAGAAAYNSCIYAYIIALIAGGKMDIVYMLLVAAPVFIAFRMAKSSMRRFMITFKIKQKNIWTKK